MKDKIIDIDVSNIDDFPNHPFKINHDLNYNELELSILENGILVPAIVRKKDDGKYEMISGNRRKDICLNNNIKSMPCIIKKLSDEEATIMMVDSNLQREQILPSEKAYAYNLKNEILKKAPKGPNNKYEEIGSKYGDCITQVKRHIRLTNLIPELQQLVDDTVLKDKRTNLTMELKPAVKLSYLKKEEQELVYEEISYEELTPSLIQAKKLRELS